MRTFFLMFPVITCAFALAPLERDEILFGGDGEINNGKFLSEFYIADPENGLYLDLSGLDDFKIFLNGALVCDCKNGNGTKKTVDLSSKKYPLTHTNRLEIASPHEGAALSFLLWRSRAQWYYGTFHIHTTYSDGIYSVSEILNEINNEGGNFCAISDHDTLGQCYDTAFHRTGNCEPIRATEWTTDSGHACVLGLEGANSVSHNSVMAMVDDATYRGGLVQINHPCDDELGMGWDHYPNLDPGVDVIEIFNAQTWFPMDKLRSDAEAVAWWHALLTQGKRIAASGNSDYHGSIPGEAPLEAHSAVYAASDHPDTILKALKLGKAMVCDAMADSRLYLYADTNGNNVMDLIMGENAVVLSGSKNIKFRLEVTDADVMDEVIVYAREGEIFSQTLLVGGNFEYEWERMFTSTDSNFMRVELLAFDGDYEYCTNPIYVNYPEYELGPCDLNTYPLALPETLFVNEDETLYFYLGNEGLVSPYRFGMLVAVETLGFDIAGWQASGPGIGEVINTPNLSGYEILEWKGGYPYSVRLSPDSSFTYWLEVVPKNEGWQKIFYRSWADDRLFMIDKDPETGFLGPDAERWYVDSIFIAPQTSAWEGAGSRPFQFSYQPNPVNDRFIITFPPGINKPMPVSIKIYDIKGALIKTCLPETKNENEENTININTKDLKCGVYFIIGEIGQNKIKRKFVVAR